MVPWLVAALVGMVASAATAAVFGVIWAAGWNLAAGLCLLLAAALVTVAWFYFWSVVVSHFYQIKEGRASRGARRQGRNARSQRGPPQHGTNAPRRSSAPLRRGPPRRGIL